MKTLLFEAFDTLFFREARPLESIGARPVAGRFPPGARTVAGAVRGLVGAALGVDWPAYSQGRASPDVQAVEAVIGKAKEPGIGALRLTGPYPTRNGERLYPAPLSLLAKREGAAYGEWARLTPDATPTACDMGTVHLMKASPLEGAKPLENVWLTRADLECVLSGGEPCDPVDADELFAVEGRLGIAMDHNRRGVAEGALYQTLHARPKPGIAIGVGVAGLPAGFDLEPGVVRLGGESRFAGFSVRETSGVAKPLRPEKPENWRGLLLMLLTPARFDEGCWYPPGFREDRDAQKAKVWRGEIEGIDLTLLSAMLGKSAREGGWDLANHRSRPGMGLIPAGSVFFCAIEPGPNTAKDALDKTVEILQGKKIGYETEFGRGELAVGYWEGVNT